MAEILLECIEPQVDALLACKGVGKNLLRARESVDAPQTLHLQLIARLQNSKDHNRVLPALAAQQFRIAFRSNAKGDTQRLLPVTLQDPRGLLAAVVGPRREPYPYWRFLLSIGITPELQCLRDCIDGYSFALEAQMQEGHQQDFVVLRNVRLDDVSASEYLRRRQALCGDSAAPPLPSWLHSVAAAAPTSAASATGISSSSAVPITMKAEEPATESAAPLAAAKASSGRTRRLSSSSGAKRNAAALALASSAHAASAAAAASDQSRNSSSHATANNNNNNTTTTTTTIIDRRFADEESAASPFAAPAPAPAPTPASWPTTMMTAPRAAFGLNDAAFSALSAMNAANNFYSSAFGSAPASNMAQSSLSQSTHLSDMQQLSAYLANAAGAGGFRVGPQYPGMDIMQASAQQQVDEQQPTLMDLELYNDSEAFDAFLSPL